MMRCIRAVPVRTDAERVAGQIRVCHVIHSLRQGGAEHVLVTLAQVASHAGLHLSVVSLMPDDDLLYAQQLRELGVEVRSLGLPSRWDVRGLPRAVRLIEKLRPDVIHTHLKHADLVGAYVTWRLSLPMVSTLHMIEDTPKGMQRFKRRVAAQARLWAARRTIAVSDAQRAWYEATFGPEAQRVVTVRNGVVASPGESYEAHDSIRRGLGIPPSCLLAAVVAILRPGKGHEDLLNALRLLPPDVDLRVVIAGDGPMRTSLERSVAEDPVLHRRVVFAGFVEDVEGLLAVSDMIVHPSHFDALPTALIYASAAGLPAIATDVGGIPEIVPTDGGLLVPPADPGALAAAITKFAEDPLLRATAGAAARRRFEEEFDARTWADRLHEVYGTVLAEQGR